MMSLTVVLCFIFGAAALQSVRLAIKRDRRSSVSNHFYVNAHFGSPALEHKLLLSSFPTNGTGVFHCLGSLSKTYDPENENDLVRFTERGLMSSKRTLIRASVWHHCETTVDSEPKAIRAAVLRSCAEDSCDGVLNLRTESPIWRAFAAFTLTRNTLELHTSAPWDKHQTHTLCAPHEATIPSYCTFNATVAGRPVLVSLVADMIGVTVPEWLSEKQRLEIEIPGAEALVIDIRAIESEREILVAKSAFSIGNDGDDDDDDDMRHTALAGEKELTLIATGPQPIDKNAPRDRILLGTGLLMNYSVRKTLLPLESVSFSLLAIREHWTALESFLLCGFYFHMVQLMLHSSMLNGMVIAGTAPVVRVAWLEWMSATITLGAFVYLIYAVSNSVDSAALEQPLVVFLIVQMIGNALVLMALWVLSAGQRKLAHHWWLLQSGCSEQIVSLAMLTISLVVRLTVDGRTVIAMLMAMIVVGNSARNVYQALNLFMPIYSPAWSSVAYRLVFWAFTLSFNFLYPAIQLMISVFFVVTGNWVIVVLLALVAIGLGMHLVDTDRETERRMSLLPSDARNRIPISSHITPYYHHPHNFNILHYF